MAPPKKGTKMDLGSFLADDSLGGNSWADEEVDLNTIGVAVTTAAIPEGQSQGHMAGSHQSGGGFSGSSGGFREPERRERVEYPVPDQPPYKAKVSNLPWEIDQSALVNYFEKTMQLNDIVEDIDLPVDRETGRLKGFAFITFKEREVLEEALKVSTSEFQGRRIFVNVAAPRNTGFDNDWRSGRSGPLGGREPRREEPEFDWGAARNSQASLPQRERSDRSDRPDRGERPPRRAEPDLDWGVARGQQLPPREPRERPERSERPPRNTGPDLDWSSARGQQLPPREPRERPERSERPPRNTGPDLDWSSARGQQLPPREPRERSFKPKTDSGPELDWVRGQSIPKRSYNKKVDDKKDDQPKPQKSAFSVLDVEDDGDEEEEEDVKKVESQKNPADSNTNTGLESTTAKLSLGENENDGWEVVGK